MGDQTLQLYDGLTNDLCVVNPVDGVAFKGGLNSGISWHCPNCQAIIAEAIYPRQLFNLLFRCHSCGQLSSSSSRTPGQPIPGRPVVLQRGEWYVKTVDLTDKMPMPIIGYQAWDGYLNETAAPPIPFASATGNQNEMNAAFLRELAARAVKLLGDDYPRLEASSKKSAASRTPKRNQPRLIELLSYAEECAKLLEGQRPGEMIGLDGARINELLGTILIFDRWRDHPAWPQLAKGLTTETEGPHSLMLLTAASYLSDNGNGVGIVFEKTTGRIADLWVEPDLTQKVDIEIKTPQAFRNVQPGTLSIADAETIITRQLDKAASTKRGQFGGNSGILAIGAFHLPTGGLDQLASLARRVLERQARASRKPNLVGILLSEFGFEIRTSNSNPQSLTLASKLTSRFVSHPGYKGKARIQEGLPRWQQGFPSDTPSYFDLKNSGGG